MCFCLPSKRTSRFVQKLSPRRMLTWRRPRWPWSINVVSHATSSMLVLLKCLRHGQLIPLWPWIQSPNAPQIASLLSHMRLYKLFSDVGGVASCSLCTSWLSLGAPYTLSSGWALESAARKVYWMRLSGFVSNPLVRWLEFTSSKSMYTVYMSPVKKSSGCFWTVSASLWFNRYRGTYNLGPFGCYRTPAQVDGLVHIQEYSFRSTRKYMGNPKCLELPTTTVYIHSLKRSEFSCPTDFGWDVDPLSLIFQRPNRRPKIQV